MHTTSSAFDVTIAVLLTGWCLAMWVSVAVLYRRDPSPRGYRIAVAVTLAGLVGQLGHVHEHIAQAIYWLWHPNEPGWMTPLGDSLSRGFGQLTGTEPSVGMEFLHLVGNFLFLAGLVGAMFMARHVAASRAYRWAKMGVIMQALHGLEHLVLTVTAAAGMKPVGLSTWFGLLEDGPGLWTHRVWWHFLANLVGTGVFLTALVLLRRSRQESRRSSGTPHQGDVVRV